jgi:5-formyltetrahydrofolate cyclo-ligase
VEIAEAKRRARGEAAKLRAEAHRLWQATAGEALAGRGLPFARQPHQHIVSGFHPYRSETTTLPLLDRLNRDGWRTALPVVVGEGAPLIFRAWRPGDPTVAGVWDIQVPPPAAPAVDPDVLLVPMLAFDRRGYRLGYGGGFYDRTLALLRARKAIVAVGIAYAAQEMPQVPHGPGDQRLDYVMTERESFACG